MIILNVDQHDSGEISSITEIVCLRLWRNLKAIFGIKRWRIGWPRSVTALKIYCQNNFTVNPLSIYNQDIYERLLEIWIQYEMYIETILLCCWVKHHKASRNKKNIFPYHMEILSFIKSILDQMQDTVDSCSVVL